MCKCLDEIKNKIGEKEAFDFVNQYDFLSVFGRDDFDKEYFEEHMKWFMDYYHALEESNMKKRTTDEIIQNIKNNENINQALEKAREICKPDEVMEFVLIATLKSLDVAKLGITSSQTQFENIIPYLKPMVNTV